MYNLPPNYTERLQPNYFNDVLPDADQWQRDVYLLAARLARQAGVKRIVDIGCGRAGKLMRLAGEFETVGIDYGQNIEYCRNTYSRGEWEVADFESEDLLGIEQKWGGVIVCADVIEHLINPIQLIWFFKSLLMHFDVPYILLSTPARERMYNQPHYGMPDNKAHVREWTLDEFTGWLESEGLPIVWKGYTVSYAKQPDKRNTILVILSNSETVEDMPLAFEEVK